MELQIKNNKGQIKKINRRIKCFFSFKKIETFKEKLQVCENNESKDIVAVNEQLNERERHCEILEAKIIFFNIDIEKSKEQNKELLQVFEEQENGIKEEIIELRTQLGETRKFEKVIRNKLK